MNGVFVFYRNIAWQISIDRSIAQITLLAKRQSGITVFHIGRQIEVIFIKFTNAIGFKRIHCNALRIRTQIQFIIGFIARHIFCHFNRTIDRARKIIHHAIINPRTASCQYHIIHGAIVNIDDIAIMAA